MKKTIYKRDDLGKIITKDIRTLHKRVRFRNKEIDIDRTIKIGRDMDNDICILDDPLVSRRHALIEQEGKDFFITDKDSTNGTFLNNNPVPRDGRARIKSGDVVKIGKTCLEIV